MLVESDKGGESLAGMVIALGEGSYRKPPPFYYKQAAAE